MGNGAADADGAQARGAERVSVTQGVHVVGRSESVDSGDIGGAGAQLGEAEDVEDMVATQDSTEATHGAAMGGITMDYGAVNAEEGAEECQDELTVEERSMING